jgi:hypothetical protein
MHKVERHMPYTGWVKIGTPCRKCRGEKAADDNDATCPECNCTGENIVDVSLNTLVEYVKDQIARDLRQQMTRS